MKADRTLPKVASESGLRTGPARVVAFPSRWESQRKTTSIGVGLACGAVAMWYAPLFIAVLRIRFMHHQWPAAGALSSALPWSALAIVLGLLSAAALTFVARASAFQTPLSPRQHANQAFAMAAWPAALVASTGFCVTSIVLHYRTATVLASAGLDLRSGPAGSTLFGFVLLDIVALTVGAGALLFMTIRLLLGRWHPARPLPASPWSVYLRCAAGLAAVGFLVSFLGT